MPDEPTKGPSEKPVEQDAVPENAAGAVEPAPVTAPAELASAESAPAGSMPAAPVVPKRTHYARPEEDWFASPHAAAALEPVAPAPEPAPAPQPEPEPEPATVPAGSRIVLVVSSGPSPAPPAVPVPMPDVAGERQGAALAQLQQLGLAVQVLHDRSDLLPKGYVLGQYPAAGAGVQPGGDGVLLVSTGRAQLPAPDVMLPRVVGMHQSLAMEALAASNLVGRIVYDSDPVAAPGHVLAQIPSEESLATPPSKRGTWLWAAIAGVLILIASIAGLVLFLNRPTTIPNLTGLTQVQAEQSVERAGFTLGSVTTSQTANEKEIGTVTGQSPLPGGTAAHGSAINLIIAGGQVLVSVPNVVGMTKTDGIKALQDGGLGFEQSQAFSSSVPSGAVISQAPAAGQKVPPGTTIGLSISMGVQTVTVPNVIGQQRTTAETSLKSSGLNVATATNYDTATPVGQVIGQQPTVGTGVLPGAYVGLTISKGTPPVGTIGTTVPAVAGKTETQAKKALKKVQLKYLVVSRTGTGQPKGKVVAQLPDAGAVPKKSVVILFVADGL